MFKRLGSREKNSLDVNRSDVYGLALYIPDYNGPGAHSSLSGGIGSRHYRSTSTETTASSKKFVHPFAQSPRPYTPPMSQTNFQRENDAARDSLAMGEEDYFPRSESNLSSHRAQVNKNNNPSGPAPLRIQTSRRAYTSQTTLHSPQIATNSKDQINTMISPSSIRSSFERAIPKMRSHSDLKETPIGYHNAVKHARLAFEKKQNEKDQKIALEEAKAAERQKEREERQNRKSATSARSKRSRSDLTNGMNEKSGEAIGVDYNNTSHRTPPVPVHIESYGSNSRGEGRSAKKSIHSLWVEFILWLRTKIFKLGRRLCNKH